MLASTRHDILLFFKYPCSLASKFSRAEVAYRTWTFYLTLYINVKFWKHSSFPTESVSHVADSGLRRYFDLWSGFFLWGWGEWRRETLLLKEARVAFFYCRKKFAGLLPTFIASSTAECFLIKRSFKSNCFLYASAFPLSPSTSTGRADNLLPNSVHRLNYLL